MDKSPEKTGGSSASDRNSRHAERLTVCPVCGEIFDASDDTQAAHHAMPDHRPLLA
jgi:hypothetical protein